MMALPSGIAENCECQPFQQLNYQSNKYLNPLQPNERLAMKTSEILLAATHHLSGHKNCKYAISSYYICNAVDLAGVSLNLSFAREQEIRKMMQREINNLAAEYGLEGNYAGLRTVISIIHRVCYKLSDPEYLVFRDNWLAALIDKLQAQGD